MMTNRLHSIDAARALFLLLGIPFHFTTISIWTVKVHAHEILMSPAISIFVALSHSFRMFAFFILSGYFSALIIQKRGKRAWFSDRIERLGVPFVASLFTIGVAINVLQRYIVSGQLVMPSWNSVSIGYLWFLIVLLMYVAALYLLIGKISVPDTVVTRALSLMGWPGILLISLLAFWGLGRSALDIIMERGAIPFAGIWSHFILHAPAFAIGAAAQLSSVKERLFMIARARFFVIAAIVAVAVVYLEAMARPSLGLSVDKSLIEKVITNAIELPAALLFSLCVFRLLESLVTKEKPWITFFVQGAMSIYLFHMLWVVVVIYALASVELYPEVRWVLGSILALGLSSISYMIVRNHPWLSAAYCGTRLPRSLKRPAKV
jgi:glucan biosynthesis protein C